MEVQWRTALFQYMPCGIEFVLLCTCFLNLKKNKEKQGIRHVNKGLKKYFKQEGKAIVLNEIARKRKASKIRRKPGDLSISKTLKE